MKILNNTITKNKLFSSISQEDIFEMYLGPFTLSGLSLNTIRGETKPSVSYKYYGDILMAKDYANWEYYGDCTQWAKLYYKYIKGESYTDFEIMNKILEDANTSLVREESEFKRSEKKEPEYSTIRIEARIKDNQLQYTAQDRIYWRKFGITEETLRLFGVISCKKVWIDSSKRNEFFKEGLMFAYYSGDGLYKIYRPLDKPEYKWRSNIPCLTNIDDIRLQSGLKTTHILYDNDFKSNDNPGQTSALKLSREFSLVNVFIESKYRAKDISDFRLLYGDDKTKQLLKELIGEPENKLILTKSRKDRMVLYTYGYSSYSFQTEGIIPKELPY